MNATADSMVAASSAAKAAVAGLFSSADILVPAENVDRERWSVIACDQHTSEPDYWDSLERFIGDAPSTLNLMLPEARLSGFGEGNTEAIRLTMERYLETGIFRTLEDSYVFVERTLSSGTVRRGIVGKVDLGQYDYAPGSVSPVRATEGTVESRLPPRAAIRERAPLEMPHIMIFVNDPEDLLVSACVEVCRYGEAETLYDFTLNSGGGKLKGTRIHGAAAEAVDAAFGRLVSAADEKSAATGRSVPVLAIGDGNHSLAAAKLCGDRYALAEIVNIHDPAVTFEPIHRVLFGVDPAGASVKARECGLEIAGFEETPEGGAVLSISGLSEPSGYGELIRAAERFCTALAEEYGGTIDYIHNDDTAVSLGSGKGCLAVLLPALDKSRLFDDIAAYGPYPKKSFSIGHADDKRFYMECRRR